MDTVTHGLTGWLVSRAMPEGFRKKEGTAALIAGSLLPDADNVASLLGGELYVRLHRGISHSVLGVSLTSLVLALLLYRFGKWKDLKKLYLLALLGQVSHILLDLLNAYGTQIFQPFSDARVSFDLLFVIDLVFTGIVAGGIILSRRGAARPARAALAVLTTYVALAAGLHLRTEALIAQAARSHGVPVVSAAALPRLQEVPVEEALSFLVPVREAWAEHELPELPPLPTTGRPGRYPLPAGPLAWNGFIDDGTTYIRAEVNPLTGEVVWKQRVRRGRDLPEVKAVEELSAVKTYLWFARFPAVHTAREGDGRVLTFYDLRFGEIPRRRRPFLLRVIERPGQPPESRWG